MCRGKTCTINTVIDIVVNELNDVLRVPKRFVTETDGLYSVQTKSGEIVATTTVELLLDGNDGWVAVTGINNGDTVVAP